MKVLLTDGSNPAPAARVNVIAARQWALDLQSVGRRVAAEYVAGQGPFPERAPIVSLTVAFLWDFCELVQRWADWAEGVVDGWEDDPAASDDPGVNRPSCGYCAERVLCHRRPLLTEGKVAASLRRSV